MSSDETEIPSVSLKKNVHSNKSTCEDEILIKHIFYNDELLNQFMLDSLTILVLLNTKNIDRFVGAFEELMLPRLLKKYENFSILELDDSKNNSTSGYLRLSTDFGKSLEATFTRTLKENLPRFQHLKEIIKKIIDAVGCLDLTLAGNYIDHYGRTVSAAIKYVGKNDFTKEEIEKIKGFFELREKQIRGNILESKTESTNAHGHKLLGLMTFMSLLFVNEMVLQEEVSTIKCVIFLAVALAVLFLKMWYERNSNFKQQEEQAEQIIFDLSPKIVVKLQVIYAAREEKEMYSGGQQQQEQQQPVSEAPTPSYPSDPLRSRVARGGRDSKRSSPLRPSTGSQQPTFDTTIGGTHISYNPRDLKSSNAFLVRNSHIQTFVSVSDELRTELSDRGFLGRVMKNISQAKFARAQGDQGLKFLTFILDAIEKKKLAIYEAKLIGSFLGDTRALGAAMTVKINDTDCQFIHLCVLCENAHRPKKLYEDLRRLLKVINSEKDSELQLGLVKQ